MAFSYYQNPPRSFVASTSAAEPSFPLVPKPRALVGLPPALEPVPPVFSFLIPKQTPISSLLQASESIFLAGLSSGFEPALILLPAPGLGFASDDSPLAIASGPQPAKTRPYCLL